MRQLINNKYLIPFFIVFWFFTIIGSSLYIGSTMLSIRNLLFPFLFVLIYTLRGVKLNKKQFIIFLPIGLLFLYGTISLLFIGNTNLEVIKDYFYFSFVPTLFVSIILLSNKFKLDFFDIMNKYSYYFLYFLFSITLFEFFTDIHLAVHTPNRFHIPSAFFTNANDLSVVVIQLFMLISILKKRTDPQWKYTLAFVLTTFIVFITLSRLALVAFIIISIFILLSKSFRWKDLIINIIVISLSLLYLSIDLPTAKTSSTVVDRSKTRISSMTEIDYGSFESTEESIGNTSIEFDNHGDTVVSSTHVRLDIYKIPLRNPEKFIFGYGFNSDKQVITKYKTLPYKIINSHSYFIQLIFYFGWIGLTLMLLFFGVLGYYSIINLKQWAFFLPVIFTQALLLNIPSSVMRFPLVWIPFFIAIAYYTNLNKKIK